MFKLDQDSTGIYTEPVVFGPAVNGLEGLGHAEVTRYSVAWQTDGEALSRFLPPDYELSAPVIVIDYEKFERVRWLSGRSFHRVRVQTPVTAGGKPGLFNMVTWEDNGDVCLYDRDVRGVPAEYADFKVTEDAQDSCVTAELSSWGFTFLKLSFKKDTSDDFCRINDLPGDTTFLYRYLPRTGEGFTKHDACYTVCRKHSVSRTLTEGALGSAEWVVPGFEQMPIQHTFTRELALLPIIQVCGAGCGRYTYQAPDGEDSIILEAGQDAILDPSKMYMAPANFAACVSPRRRTDGKRYIYDDPINTDRYAVIYEVEHPEKLRELVPEGLEPAGGYLIVAVDYLTEIAWLAGKSYALLTVNIPVTSGSTLDDPIKGAFMCAIWENEMDPILTGREQLGFCKILCEIEPPRQKDKAFTIVAKEYGREFLKLRVDMARLPKDLLKMATKANTGKGIFHYKYFPRVGEPGQADANCLVIQPPEELPADVPAVPKKTVKLGRGRIRWTALDRKYSPAHTRIITTLAELGVKKVYGGAYQHFYTRNDLFNQRVVRDYKAQSDPERRIAIYGCGAMGTVLGAFLTRGGLNVDMVDIYQEHVDALNEKGAALTGFEDFTTPVHAITPSQMEGIYDLVILLCKQTANMEAFEAIKPFVDEKSTILTIQNGVPEPSVTKAFGEARVIGGTILWGATFIGPGVSEVTEPLKEKLVLFEIGTVSGEINDRVRMVRDVLSVMGPTEIVRDLMAARWTKVTLNACMSGMSAALGSTFGDVMDSKKAMEIIGQIGYEAGMVNKAAGLHFAPVNGIKVDKLFKLGPLTRVIVSKMIPIGYKSMRTAKASMLQDLERGRLTEVDMLNGYICAEGRRLGIKTPANDKIVEIIHGIEDGKYELSFDNLNLFKTK